MINNRQGGRRRGRGGQRPQGMGGQPGGNRQDNRQRGNAAQLLEKYKSMARDAQLAGDRVQTEYYLQFADHYYRILGESRARFEEQRRARGEDMDEDESDEEMLDAGDDQGNDEDRNERPQRRERYDRADQRPERGERPRRFERSERDDDGSSERSDRGERQPRVNGNGAGESIPLDVLPPAIGAVDGDTLDGGEEEAPRPRRRARRPRSAEGEADIAPAA